MDSNQLFKYVQAKYGLKFEPIVPGSTSLYVLMSPADSSYFAMLSRVKSEDLNKRIAVLDLKCGEFAATIRDLPGFTDPLRVKEADWVGAMLNSGNDSAIKKALDYAFKLAMNGKGVNVAQSQYLYIPQEDGESQYHAQAIRPRKRIIKQKTSIPPQIKKMQEIYDYSILPSQGRQKNFYRQGQLMADYEDHYDKFFAFKRFYPTYHDMTLGQLRSYFAWRSKLHQGKYEKTSTSYAFVYIYELLNNIGVDPLEGYQKLLEFEKNYVEKYDLTIKPYLEDWLKDYVLFYKITDQIEVRFAKEIQEDRDYIVLRHPEKFTPEKLAMVFTKKSSYWNSSKLIAKHKKLFEAILFYAWQEILNAKKYGIAYYSNFVAKAKIIEQPIFAGSVFYNRQHDTFNIEVDSARKYCFRHGKWQIFCDQAVKRQGINLNNFAHELDRLIRTEFKIGRSIKPRFVDSAVVKAIKAGIELYKKQTEKEKIDRIRIDFSNLDTIRANASETRDSLLTEEEKELEQQEQKQEVEQVSSYAPVDNDYDLDKNEMFLLVALLQKTNWHEYVKKNHLLTSVLADGINEKLFDEFGDAVIEFNEQDQPKIIEDYADDLKEMFLKG